MCAIDRHYTPMHIADAIAGALDLDRNGSIRVADFAAGRGALLEAVERHFENTECVATDADRLAVRKLRARHPTWQVGRCDFLNTSSLTRSRLIQASEVGIDAVVLNPPFSCRGGHTVTSDALDHRVSSGVAMAFVLRSLERIGPNGQLAALLPIGCLSSEKDDAAWRLIRRHAVMRIVDRFGRGEFKGAFAQTVLVHLRRMQEAARSDRLVVKVGDRSPSVGITLYRGRFPVHRIAGRRGGCCLVHTTDIRGGMVVSQSARAPARLGVPGPLLLVPRVGLPRADKVSLYRGVHPIVLSDCLFALGGPVDLLEEMQRRIVRVWDIFRTCYGGSCAPYTTVRRLSEMLTALGAHVAPEPRLRPVPPGSPRARVIAEFSASTRGRIAMRASDTASRFQQNGTRRPLVQP